MYIDVELNAVVARTRATSRCVTNMTRTIRLISYQEEDKEKWAKLEPFLEKVQAYARILKTQMESAKTSYDPSSVPVKAPSSIKPSKKGKSKRHLDEPVPSKPAKRAKTGEADPTDLEMSQDEAQTTGESSRLPVFKQSVLVTGATLKDYQLEGVAWMVGLYSQGISGILGASGMHICDTTTY